MNSAPWDNDYETAIADAKKKDIVRQAIARQSNANGHEHENLIEGACRLYMSQKRAYIVKEPEPFIVKHKNKDFTFLGQLGRKAQPDFHGTLKGGRSIVFEAKHTETDRIKRSVISERQEESLNRQRELGALTFVCIGIKGDAFMVPWSVFRDMKANFGRLYVKAEDLERYRVRNVGIIYFLDYTHPSTRNIFKRQLED